MRLAPAVAPSADSEMGRPGMIRAVAFCLAVAGLALALPAAAATPERVKVNGGSVAIGHPVGATGARILMTLIYELRRRGGGRGLATICGAGANGCAAIVETE